MREHHLRERRLKLGATQELIGCLAGWSVSAAQTSVSAVERGVNKSAWAVRKVRSAIVYLESEPRRHRKWARDEEAAAATTEAAILLNRTPVIIDRLVDLLFDGRSDDFDALAARVSADIADAAGNKYLDAIRPCVA